MSFWEKTKGFLLSPTKTFNSVKDEDWGSSISYFAKWLIIWAILITIIFAALLVWIRGMFESWAGLYPEIDITQLTALFDLFAGPMVIGMGILAIISGLIGVLIGSLWMHIWVYICGGRKGVGQTIKSMAYGNTPSFLLGWVPFVGIIFAIWTLVVQIIGIRQLHEISTGRAVLAYIIGVIIIPAIIFAIAFAAIISALLGMMPPT
jgi:hypothetical protein